MPELVRPLHERVAALRTELRGLSEEQEIHALLCTTDLWTLRELERDYHMLPAPPLLLRCRLTLAHLQRMRTENIMSTTAKVTPEVVRDWALLVLADGLPGVSDFNEEHGGQYFIELTGPAGPGADATGMVLQVSTYDGKDPRQFVVAVAAAPVDTPPQQVGERRQAVIETAIREFPWSVFGLDAVDDTIDDGRAEWLPELAKAIRGRLEADAAGQVTAG